MSGREEIDLGGVELVAVAKAVRVRGLKGEVVCELLTDFPERFEWVEELIGVAPSGARKMLALERHWLQKGRVVLKFVGYDTPEAAQGLVGWELTVPESEAVELEEGEYYDWQLVGCRVETVDNRSVGTVREVLHAGAAPVLVIRDERDRENLVPLAESICVEVDTEAKLIRVDAPEGLIEF
ncbi:MAG TPA: ribosome maturation factor RimM [Pyrinomonadaceae bacterium]